MEWKSHFHHLRFAGCAFFPGFPLPSSLLLAIGFHNLKRKGKKPLQQQMLFAIFAKNYTCFASSEFIITVWRSTSCYFFLTSLHTIDSISAVTFIISLWQSVTNPPVLHVNAWSILYFALQIHSYGKRFSCYLYLSKTASKNSCLVNANLSCFNGKDDNHVEVPSDVAILLPFVLVPFWRFLRRLS